MIRETLLKFFLHFSWISDRTSEVIRLLTDTLGSALQIDSLPAGGLKNMQTAFPDSAIIGSGNNEAVK
jgi:hypothetical protein